MGNFKNGPTCLSLSALELTSLLLSNKKKKWHEDIAVQFNSDYLAPLPTQKILLCSYDEDMKQMVSGELPTHPSLSQRNT